MTMNDDVSGLCRNVQHLRKSAYSRASMSSERGCSGGWQGRNEAEDKGKNEGEVEIRKKAKEGELVNKWERGELYCEVSPILSA